MHRYSHSTHTPASPPSAGPSPVHPLADDAPDLGEQVVVGRLLGRGGMADVFDVRDRVTGAPLALKRIVPQLAVKPSARARFENEVDLLNLCRGPWVLRLVASGSWQGSPAYLCERCAGSLGDLGRDAPLPLTQVLLVAAELLTGLDRVHALGVVHRDIKPSNILLTDSGAIRLADFGIARHPSRRLTVAGQSVGTPIYAAPELVRDPTIAEPMHDLYSVGLMILALSTHARTRGLIEPLRRPATLARFRGAVRVLLDRSTAPEVHRRYRSAAEMVLDVQRALTE